MGKARTPSPGSLPVNPQKLMLAEDRQLGQLGYAAYRVNAKFCVDNILRHRYHGAVTGE
jgi:hypothetical protein